ncbi:MAG TPA: hypothetical protein VID95_12290 [Candidatus Limnocylindrales bacterium]|jgi:hypothetical protein
MPIRVEIYTAGGIAVGVLPRASHLRDALEAGDSLRVEAVTWHPLDDTAAGEQAEIVLAPDDIHLATVEESEDLPVHAQWHDIVLDVGPYRVLGQLATMPGFDPGRALARPTGEFVQLRDVSVGLLAEDAEGLSRPLALVNRYVVDRVEADLMLGFFFPGAEMISTKTEEPIFITSTPSLSTSSSPATPDADATTTEPDGEAPAQGDAGEPAEDEAVTAPLAPAAAAAAPATEGA